MKLKSFLAFLFTLMAIIVLILGFAMELIGILPFRVDCEGYSLLLFADEEKVDTVVGKGELVKIRAINAGNFGDRYRVYLSGPEWAVIKPDSFSLRAEEAKTLFLYVSPDLGAEGKYYVDVTVESKCVSESERLEIGVLPRTK